MRIIDLLNKIANGEEVPLKIEYKGEIYNRQQNIENSLYYYQVLGQCKFLLEQLSSVNDLIDEVEILEEEKETKPLTKKDIEALGYACGEIQKCFTNGWNKSLKNKPLEEEKKIPEKLEQILSKRGKYNSIDELAEEVFKAFETIDDLIINQNQLINYLKSKGE